MENVYPLALLAVMFGAMYFLMIRPQKKEEKKMREQINAMRIGDSVVTIGGVVGKVMNISDDEITIATSVANTMLTFKKQAISSVVQTEENKKLAEKAKADSPEVEKKGLFDRFKKNDKDKSDVE